MPFRRKPEKMFKGSLASFEEREALQRNAKLLERLKVMEKTYFSMLSDQGESFAKSNHGIELAEQIARLRAGLGIKQSKPSKPVD